MVQWSERSTDDMSEEEGVVAQRCTDRCIAWLQYSTAADDYQKGELRKCYNLHVPRDGKGHLCSAFVFFPRRSEVLRFGVDHTEISEISVISLL